MSFKLQLSLVTPSSAGPPGHSNWSCTSSPGFFDNLLTDGELPVRFQDCYLLDGDNILGKGGFGTVFLGVRIVDKSEVAVKRIMKARVGHTPELAKTIENEVKFLQKLDHDHIIKFFNFFDDLENKCFYLCVELARGGDLFDRVSKKKKYTEKDAQQFCRTVLSALKHCHDQHIVHRDLKPENFMLRSADNDHDILLVDFGLAAEDRDVFRLKGEVGTTSYMAPEIIRGETYGKPVDMWALGVITFILLCGYPPFYADDVKTMKDRILSASYDFQHASQVSAESRDFIAGLLVVDMHKRMTADQGISHPWVSTFSFVSDGRDVMM
jgi:calcium/calmodulin-dependent protein kinase I